MRTLILISYIFILCACSGQENSQVQDPQLVDYATLEMRGDSKDPVAFFEEEPFTGIAVIYANGGIKYIEQEYVAGKSDGMWRVYFTNGQLQKEGLKLDGLEHGTYREWYENGNLKYEYHYDRGSKTGKWLSWYEDGTRYTERNFLNDQVHGKVLVYDERGKLAKEYDYVNGRMVNSEMHFKEWEE